MRNFLKIIFRICLILLAIIPVVLLIIYIVFNWPVAKSVERSQLGVTFSNRYAEDIGLNWKDVYLALLSDLKIKKIRIPIYWDAIEKNEGKYDFSDIDWQLRKAEENEAEIILTVGQKVPRWPECFIPEWARDDDIKRKKKLLELIEVVVNKYKNNYAVKYWQIENEPFLSFGICPKFDVDLLDKEIELVKRIDPSRKIIVTDSGELSIWHPAAKRADIFGTTMYLDVCSNKIANCFTYPIGPNFFRIKKQIIKTFSNQENAIVIELQGEPWLNGWTVSKPLNEQLEAMNGEKLKKHVYFAEEAGFSDVYLWGVEWWYWLKEKQNHPELWITAKKIFEESK